MTQPDETDSVSVFDPRAAIAIHYLPLSQPIVTLPFPSVTTSIGLSGFLVVSSSLGFIPRRYEKAMLTHYSILA